MRRGSAVRNCTGALPLRIGGLAGHLFLWSPLAAIVTVALAARAEQPTLRIPRTETPPQLSRYLDMKTAPPGVRVTDFRQREPGDGTPSSVETAAYLSYDSTNLYVVFLRKDDPSKVRANYQFTRRLSLRAILDYASVLPNSDFVALDLDKNLRSDLLLTYLVNPWTAIYAGYTDAYANIGDTVPGGSEVPRPGSPSTSVGRQLFIKASYLFRW